MEAHDLDLGHGLLDDLEVVLAHLHHLVEFGETLVGVEDQSADGLVFATVGQSEVEELVGLVDLQASREDVVAVGGLLCCSYRIIQLFCKFLGFFRIYADDFYVRVISHDSRIQSNIVIIRDKNALQLRRTGECARCNSLHIIRDSVRLRTRYHSVEHGIAVLIHVRQTVAVNFVALLTAVYTDSRWVSAQRLAVLPNDLVHHINVFYLDRTTEHILEVDFRERAALEHDLAVVVP